MDIFIQAFKGSQPDQGPKLNENVTLRDYISSYNYRKGLKK